MADPTDSPGEAPVDTVATTEAPAGDHHVGLNFMGIEPAQIVALSTVLVLVLLLWKKVPGAIAKALDSKIAAIRGQLAEAEALRKEAEALKAEYQAKADAAEGEAAAMVERARHEADAIVAKAKTDAEALVARRTRMAEDKIAAEELAAVNQLRAAAADAATRAAARLIAERHDATADAALVDRAIGEIARR